MKLNRAFLVAAVAFFLVFAVVAEDIAVTLEVDYEGDGIIDKAEHAEMVEGSTALDLLNETTELATEVTDWGTLVVGIDGVMSNYDEDGTWWMFMVDGEPAAVTVDSFVLEQGVTITMSMEGAEGTS